MAVGELIGVGIGILVLTRLLPRLGIIKPVWYELWLPIGIYSMIISAMCRIVGRIFRPLFNIMKVLELTVNMYSTFYLLQLFPFDFSQTKFAIAEPALQLGLTIALWVMGIMILVHSVKFVVDLTKIIEGKELEKV